MLGSGSWGQAQLQRAARPLEQGCAWHRDTPQAGPGSCRGSGAALGSRTPLISICSPQGCSGPRRMRAVLGLSRPASALSSCRAAPTRCRGRWQEQALCAAGAAGLWEGAQAPRGRGEAGLEEVNYRKLRIGAGNRTNAVVTLGRGCGGAPTAQGGSVQLRHVLLVLLPVSWPGGLQSHAAGGPSLTKLLEWKTGGMNRGG